MLEDLPVVEKELADRASDCEKQTKVLELTLQRLEKETKESQNSLDEFLQKMKVSE